MRDDDEESLGTYQSGQVTQLTYHAKRKIPKKNPIGFDLTPSPRSGDKESPNENPLNRR